MNLERALYYRSSNDELIALLEDYRKNVDDSEPKIYINSEEFLRDYFYKNFKSCKEVVEVVSSDDFLCYCVDDEYVIIDQNNCLVSSNRVEDLISLYKLCEAFTPTLAEWAVNKFTKIYNIDKELSSRKEYKDFLLKTDMLKDGDWEDIRKKVICSI